MSCHCGKTKRRKEKRTRESKEREKLRAQLFRRVAEMRHKEQEVEDKERQRGSTKRGYCARYEARGMVQGLVYLLAAQQWLLVAACRQLLPPEDLL